MNDQVKEEKNSGGVGVESPHPAQVNIALSEWVRLCGLLPCSPDLEPADVITMITHRLAAARKPHLDRDIHKSTG